MAGSKLSVIAGGTEYLFIVRKRYPFINTASCYLSVKAFDTAVCKRSVVNYQWRSHDALHTRAQMLVCCV